MADLKAVLQSFSSCIDTGLGNTRRNSAVKIHSSPYLAAAARRGSAAVAAEPCAPSTKGRGRDSVTRPRQQLRAGAGHGAGLSPFQLCPPAAPRGAEGAATPPREAKACREGCGRGELQAEGPCRRRRALPQGGVLLAPRSRSLQAVYAQPRPRAGPARPPLSAEPLTAPLATAAAPSAAGGRAGSSGRRRLPAASLSAAGKGAARGLC